MVPSEPHGDDVEMTAEAPPTSPGLSAPRQALMAVPSTKEFLQCPSAEVTKAVARSVAFRLFGFLEWIPQLKLADLPGDLISGVVIGVMLLPQSLSYANVLAIPLTVGLNAGVVSGFAYAIFGTVPFLSIGAAAETTAFLLTAVTATGQERTDQILQLAFLAGIIGAGASFLRGGTLLKILMNRAVGDGYSAASATLVVVLQLKTAFNLSGASASTLHEAITVIVNGFKTGSSINTLYSFLLFMVYSTYLFSMRFLPRVPSWVPHQLIVVIVSTVVTYFAQLQDRIKLSIVKDLPPNVPTPELPALGLNTAMIPSIFVLALICFLQNYTIASLGMAGVNPDREMWASGCVNFFCGLFGGFPVLGAFSRSGVLRERSAKSPIVHIVASVLMLVTLVGLNRLRVFYFLPNHALAAIIAVAMLKMIDISVPLRLWRVNKFDFAVYVVTYFLTLFTSITIGILTGMGLSLVFVVVRIARPHTAVIGYVADKGVYTNVKDDPESLVYPRILLWRFDAPLYFVNLAFFEARLQEAIRKEARPIDVVIVNGSRMLDIDAAGLTNLPVSVKNVEQMNPDHPRKVFFAELPARIRLMMIHEGVGEYVSSHDAPAVVMGATFANAPLRIFGTTYAAIKFSRKSVFSAVTSKDNLDNAPRPAVAFLTDLLTEDVATEEHESLTSESFLGMGMQDDQKVAKLIKNSRYDPTIREMIGCIAVIRHADRTPKQKLKLQLVDAKLFVLARETKGKLKLQRGSTDALTLSAALSNRCRSGNSSDTIAVATRMLQMMSTSPKGLTWQVKATDVENTVTVVAKWGGLLTDCGRDQARQHGRRLVPRFFACGDIASQRMSAFEARVCAIAGSEERLVETAVAMIAAVTHKRKSPSDVAIDDDLLMNLSQAKTSLAKAQEELSTVLHCKDAARCLLLRHLPGLSDLLLLENVPTRCDERGLTPFDVLWHVYELLVKIAGGAARVEQARREGEATEADDVPAGLTIMLSEHETAAEFEVRWAAIAASFLPNSVALPLESDASSAVAQPSVFSFERPFDTSTIPKLADYVTYDTQHNVQPLRKLVASGQEPQSSWASDVLAAMVKLEALVRALAHVSSALSHGLTSSERFVCGSLICQPLMATILSDAEQLANMDEEEGVRRELQVWLETKLKECKREDAESLSLHVDDLLPAVSVSAFQESSEGGGEEDKKRKQALLRLYFAPSSHVTALQHVILENNAVSGFHCSEEYQQQSLGYMTHLMFSVYRVVQVHDVSSAPASSSVDVDASEFPQDKEGISIILREQYMSLQHAWRLRHRYMTQVFLSTGVHTVTEQSGDYQSPSSTTTAAPSLVRHCSIVVPRGNEGGMRRAAGGREDDNGNGGVAAGPHGAGQTDAATSPALSSVPVTSTSSAAAAAATMNVTTRSQVTSMLRIHDGLSIDDFNVLVSTIEDARALSSAPAGAASSVATVPAACIATPAAMYDRGSFP